MRIVVAGVELHSQSIFVNINVGQKSRSYRLLIITFIKFLNYVFQILTLSKNENKTIVLFLQSYPTSD